MKQQTLAMATDAQSGFELHRKPTRRDEFLKTMDALVPWPALCEEIAPHYPKAGNGRRPVGLERMLRIHFIQHWFNLADLACEEALYDSASLRRFVGIDLGCEPVPDATTMLRFRHLLNDNKLGEALFARVGKELQARGIKVHTGTIVDATTIDFAGSPCSAFIPKCHCFAFLVWCISGSRKPLSFLVELGAEISVASTTVPVLSIRPRSMNLALMVARICWPRPCSSSRCPKRKTVLFEQVSKAQDGALVRQTGDARIQVGKLALQRDIVQGFFHGRFGMPEELLKQMNAQHYLNGKRRPAGLSCRRMRPNQRQQLRPWNYQIISSNNSRFRVRMVTSPNPMVARLICSMDQLSQIRP